MSAPHTSRPTRRAFSGSLMGILILLTMMLSSCGQAQSQQQASQARAQLSQMLSQAEAAGVPDSQMSSIESQKTALDSSNAPLFNDEGTNGYNKNLVARYKQLSVQTQGLIMTSTQVAQHRAQQDMETFQRALTRERDKGNVDVTYFSDRLSRNQATLSKARVPRDYDAISQDAQKATETLDQVQPTVSQLSTFKKTISQIQGAKLDVAPMQQHYQNDVQTLKTVKSPNDVADLKSMISAQYQEAVVNSNQALPYVIDAKLGDFKADIDQLKSYNVDTSNYQSKYNTDLAAKGTTKTHQDYQRFSQKLDADMGQMQLDLLKGQAQGLLKQYYSQLNDWDSSHRYQGTYSYVGGYGPNSMGGKIEADLTQATTISDYQKNIDWINTTLYNFNLLKANFSDQTPFDQPHTTDKQLLDHYQLTNKQVIVISLTDQALRLYNNGKLVRSFLVTTGQLDKETEPGIFGVLDRQTHMEFKSSDPVGSKYWFAPTPINYGIYFEQPGFFIHDATWRSNFGPNTQFPDGAGTTGSHGCVNLPLEDETWLFNNTSWDTAIAVY